MEKGSVNTIQWMGLQGCETRRFNYIWDHNQFICFDKLEGDTIRKPIMAYCQ